MSNIVPYADMKAMAADIAASGLFGMKSEVQVLALMAVAQAEGKHPAIIARDFDIVQGRPAKKAEAMLRDFIAAGGKVEWHQLDDACADATFSHPSGGTVRIAWDKARAVAAGLAGKDMYRKFPRQMLRSRTVSEGVRTVAPLATSGMYVPEEVAAFDAGPGLKAVERDMGAADVVGGEDTNPALEAAQTVAKRGTTAFREYWADLTPPEREVLRSHIAELKTLADAADKDAA